MNKQAEELGKKADELLEQMLNDAANTGNAPTPSENATSQVTAPVSAQEHQNANVWQQKFSVLDGKYKAEVPALHAKVRELQRQNADLTAQLAQAHEQLKQANPQANGKAGVSPESIREMFGDELGEAFDSMTRQIEELKKQVPSQTANAAQSQGPDAMGVPGFDPLAFVVDLVGGQAQFDAIDNSPQFSAWLDHFDPLLGATRRERMNALYEAGMLTETAQFFITFRDQQNKVIAGAKNDAREELVEPSRSKSGGNVPTGKRTYTRAEVAQIHKDLAIQPKYKTLEGQKEAFAIEADIFAASQEGRIIG